MYNHTQKLALYKAGKYSFPAPPVTHAMWSSADWIRYIDACGKWHKVDHVCGYCGSFRELIEQDGCYPSCPDCNGV